MVKRVQMLAIVEVPKHGLGVLSAGRAQRTIRRHGHGVQVTVVANVIGLKLAVGQVPDLEDITNIGEPIFALKTLQILFSKYQQAGNTCPIHE